MVFCYHSSRSVTVSKTQTQQPYPSHPSSAAARDHHAWGGGDGVPVSLAQCGPTEMAGPVPTTLGEGREGKGHQAENPPSESVLLGGVTL